MFIFVTVSLSLPALRSKRFQGVSQEMKNLGGNRGYRSYLVSTEKLTTDRRDGHIDVATYDPS